MVEGRGVRGGEGCGERDGGDPGGGGKGGRGEGWGDLGGERWEERGVNEKNK